MGRGGAERVISILANSYADKGWDVHILMLLNNRCGYELNQNIKLKLLCNEYESRIRQSPKWIYGVRRYVIENKPDIIVSFVARINIITIFACIGLNQPIVVSERNDPSADGRSLFVRLATRLLYPHADCVVFQTKWARSCFSRNIQKKSVIIPNPVHVNVQASKVKLKRIVAVGRLLEQKNHQMLICAFKKVHDDYPEYKLYIYGDGKLRGFLMSQIRDMSLSEAVFLPGNVINIHEEIADAEMFVLSSNYEGLSNALLEAMMMGLPCISTDYAGSHEVIHNGKNGLLVPVGSVDKLTAAMKRIILDSELAHKLGYNARLFAAALNSMSVLKQWDSLLD